MTVLLLAVIMDSSARQIWVIDGRVTVLPHRGGSKRKCKRRSPPSRRTTRARTRLVQITIPSKLRAKQAKEAVPPLWGRQGGPQRRHEGPRLRPARLIRAPTRRAAPHHTPTQGLISAADADVASASSRRCGASRAKAQLCSTVWRVRNGCCCSIDIVRRVVLASGEKRVPLKDSWCDSDMGFGGRGRVAGGVGGRPRC